MIKTDCAIVKPEYPGIDSYLGKHPEGYDVWRITVIRIGSVQIGHAMLWGFDTLKELLLELKAIGLKQPGDIITILEFRHGSQ